MGDPVFGRLGARLSEAMMSINASKGFEYGLGFEGVGLRGARSLIPLLSILTVIYRVSANNSGGIQGGISNGADIYFRVAFKPVATLMRDLMTVDCYGREVLSQGAWPSLTPA